MTPPLLPCPPWRPAGVLKWRLQTRDESLVPLTINCWPSVSGGESYVNIEYEATAPFDLQKVAIAIPLPALAHAPQVNQVRGLVACGLWRVGSGLQQGQGLPAVKPVACAALASVPVWGWSLWGECFCPCQRPGSLVLPEGTLACKHPLTYPSGPPPALHWHLYSADRGRRLAVRRAQVDAGVGA